MQGKHILYKQVEKHANAAAFPTPGNEFLLYYAEDTDSFSVWNGSTYEVSTAIPTAHTHVASEITDFDTEVSNNTDVAANTLKNTNVTTNLSIGTKTGTTVDVNSSDGTNATLPAATITEAGLLNATDKVKLNNTSGTNTGDQTNITGNAGTVTTNANLTGPVTSVGNATTITNDAVTNAKLANVPTQTFKGRTTAATGDPEDLTAAQATAMLNTVSSSLKGLAPASGGGTTNFLRADGSWAAPTAGAPNRDLQIAQSVSSTTLSIAGWQDLATMTLTTSNSGTANYSISFMLSVATSINNDDMSVRLLIDGVAQTLTVRQIGLKTSVDRHTIAFNTVANIATAKVVKVQWMQGAASGTLTGYGRSLKIDAIY